MANTVLLEARPYRPFKSSEEYLYAMREDLAEWLNTMYPELQITADNFMDRLDTGVTLCKHANNVRSAAQEYLARKQARNKSMTKSITSGLAGPILATGKVHFLPTAKSGTFFSRDNVSNFITWCRQSLQIFECLLFETDDLIMRKNEKHVILCLLEVARRGAKFGMLAPMLVQMERQIDREIAADIKANGVGCGTQTENGSNSVSIGTDGDLYDSDTDDEDDTNASVMIYGPQPQIVTNDLKSLDEMVRDLVEMCTCPSQFPMIRVSEGKYRIGDTKVLIFVRILRSHVMVRVGGGWDTLAHYLDKHDPCRCKSQHRTSLAARLITRTSQQTNGIELHKAQVHYDRPTSIARKLDGEIHTTVTNLTLSPPIKEKSRSRSPTAQRKLLNGSAGDNNLTPDNGVTSPNPQRRSITPNRRRLTDNGKTKAHSLDSSSPSSNVCVQFNDSLVIVEDNKPELITNTENSSTKFENISDNGSEISDEGYRSLGVINSNGTNQAKRISLHSQTSTEDAEINTHQTSSDSQISPTDETTNISENIKLIDALNTNELGSPDSTDCTVNDDDLNQFEKSGVFINDAQITLDISDSTGLRKTGFSSNLYSDDTSPKKSISKIPRSPMLSRRKSAEPLMATDENNTGLPVMNRTSPVFRSMRKPIVSIGAKESTPPISKTLKKELNGTWSGRQTKSGASIGADTFKSPLPQNTFNRNSTSRASQNSIFYDRNGRRVKSASNSTSPVKQSTASKSSPLAEQLLEAAGSAKNDAQILEKMKEILAMYSTKNGGGGGDNDRKDFDDFTTAWVNGNGVLECGATNCSTGKRSTAGSSSDSIHSREPAGSIVSRNSISTSKIPALIRQKSELY